MTKGKISLSFQYLLIPKDFHVIVGHTVVLTTCDLTEHLAAGDMLRIKKRIFKLVSVKRRSVELDRRWLEGVGRALPYFNNLL